MPRDGSGVYSPPASTKGSPNTTIESSKYNAFVDDLTADANAARPVTAGGTGQATLIEAIDTWSPNWVDVASATTTDIGAASSPNVNITGTTTITGFGTKTAGVVRRVKFAAALTLTHNGTSLVLPGGSNITTAAGDTAVFVSEGSGNWRCIGYQQSAGPPTSLIDEDDMASDSATRVPSQQSVAAYVAWGIISRQVGTSAVSSISWTDLEDYAELRLSGTFGVATDAVAGSIQFSTNNGSSYVSGASDYEWQSFYGNSTTATAAKTMDSGVRATPLAIGNVAGEEATIDVFISQFNRARRAAVVSRSVARANTGSLITGEVGGQILSDTARNALRITLSSGNFAFYDFVLEGRKG